MSRPTDGPLIDDLGMPRFNEEACRSCGGFKRIPCAQAVMPRGAKKRVICEASACCPECTSIPMPEGLVPMRPKVAEIHGRSWKIFNGLEWRKGRID
tara:strand:- start:575 stop:865 length:291 start_codon:yes stop_codon:yes gene_type:complete